MNAINGNALLRCQVRPSWPRTEHLSKGTVGTGVLYLYWEPPAIYAVFGARGSITLAPVKLHLLCLETPGQSTTSYKVVTLQENGHWRQSRGEMKGGVNTKYINLSSINRVQRYTNTNPAPEKHSTPLYLTCLELLFLDPLKAISSTTPLKGLMRYRAVVLRKAFSSQVGVFFAVSFYL